MSDTKPSTEDLTILEQLNLDYIHSDQSNDFERFRELVAYIGKLRAFKDLAVEGTRRHHV